MNMRSLRSCALFILFSLLSFNFLFAQKSAGCQSYIDSSNKYYDNGDQANALRTFQVALKAACKLTDIDMYNGACIASLSGKKDLALQYLNRAVQLGYDDTAHMEKDTDLDAIRNLPGYRSVIVTIRKDFQQLQKELSGIRPAEFGQCIPYHLKGKWGWMHAVTRKPLTSAMFRLTDLVCGKGLYFVYHDEGYFLNMDGQIVKDTERDYFGTDDGGGNVKISEEMMEQQRIYRDGFEDNGSGITAFSNTYRSADPVFTARQTISFAIVSDKNDRFALVHHDGTPVGQLDFRFAVIKPVFSNYTLKYFIARAKEEKYFTIFDTDGKTVYEDQITSYKKIEPFQQNLLNRSVFLGFNNNAEYSDYLLLTKEAPERSYLYSVSKGSKVSAEYDKIIMANGPTADPNRQSYMNNRGITRLLFLVQQKGEMYYMEADGKTLYKPTTGILK